MYDALLDAGEDLGLRHFGGRALNALRLEKGFGSFTREYTPDYTPFQAGLERFVDMRKNDFIGREALVEEQRAGPAPQAGDLQGRRRNGVDALANEPVLCDGETVGWVTSGGFCHHLEREHRARLRAERARGAHRADSRSRSWERCAMPWSIVPQPPFDPAGSRMRS